jgi:hypothetical protein
VIAWCLPHRSISAGRMVLCSEGTHSSRHQSVGCRSGKAIVAALWQVGIIVRYIQTSPRRSTDSSHRESIRMSCWHQEPLAEVTKCRWRSSPRDDIGRAVWGSQLWSLLDVLKSAGLHCFSINASRVLARQLYAQG